MQLFITNRCNVRYKGCFNQHNLGLGDMSLREYKWHIIDHLGLGIKKIILLGGEPTMHPKINNMIVFNNRAGLKTTIYTNGYGLDTISKSLLGSTDIRLGVYGLKSSEKPIVKIKRPNFPITVVFMLRRDNISEFMSVAQYAEERLGCKKFIISCIRDIATSGDYWIDTPEILPFEDYFNTVQSFVLEYSGKMDIHIAWRGVIKTNIPRETVEHCRFGNIFPNGEKIICPFDICKQITTNELEIGSRRCNKNNGNCLLQKIVLERK